MKRSQVGPCLPGHGNSGRRKPCAHPCRDTAQVRQLHRGSGDWGQLGAIELKLATPIFKAYPIYDWKVDDVWTAPAKFGWDYCEAYDLMEMAGIRPRDQRLAPPYGEQPFRHLWMWKVCFPAIWEKMLRPRFQAPAQAQSTPGRTYTVLGGPQPPHMSWEQFTQSVIEEHPANMRPAIVARIRQMINRHYKVTTDAIASYVPHPDTGLSWSLMVKIAEIADTKNRNDAIVEAGKLRNQCKGDVGKMREKVSPRPGEHGEGHRRGPGRH